MSKVRHVLGISGGKDSAALAIYLKRLYPQLPIEYYNTDTKCELAETEKLIENLKSYLGHIEILVAAEDSPEPTPFDHFLKISGGYLPSPQARWCTQKMKLQYRMSGFEVMRIERDIFQPNLIFRLYSHSGKTFGV